MARNTLPADIELLAEKLNTTIKFNLRPDCPGGYWTFTLPVLGTFCAHTHEKLRKLLEDLDGNADEYRCEVLDAHNHVED